MTPKSPQAPPSPQPVAVEAMASGSDGDRVPSMDEVACKRWTQQQRHTGPWLHDEVGRRMAERLDWIQQPPPSWVDWSPGLSGPEAIQAVQQRYQNSKLFRLPSQCGHDLKATELSASLWRKFWRKPARQTVPVLGSTEQVGMVWANMLLHAVDRPRVLMGQWLERLAVGGFVMFSGLGPDSLREIRAVYTRQGWGDPCHAFTDMHDWGDLLVSSGFADPVMDTERMELTYANADRLLADLREFGRNLALNRDRTTRGRVWRARLCAALDAHMPRDADGRLRLTLEVVYGHAYKGPPRPMVTAETRLSVADMRQMLGRR